MYVNCPVSFYPQNLGGPSESDRSEQKEPKKTQDASTLTTWSGSSRPCVVCLDPGSEACVVLLPCFHCQVCRPCASMLARDRAQGCPTCRAPIFSMRRVYF